MAKKIVKLNFGNVIKTINNKKLRKLSALLNLIAPHIDITDDILNVYDEEGLATSYDILVDGVVMDTVEVSKINLISFTISGDEYQAEEGMAWDEWVESSYNTDGFVLAGTYVSFGSNSYNWVSTEGTSSTMVDYHETITSGFAYVQYNSHNPPTND